MTFVMVHIDTTSWESIRDMLQPWFRSIPLSGDVHEAGGGPRCWTTGWGKVSYSSCFTETVQGLLDGDAGKAE